jgi:hypothetical protein
MHSSDLLVASRLLVLQSQNPSIAFLQRTMKLDYETANSLLKAMEGEVVTAIEQDGWRRILNTQTRSPDAPKLVSKDKSRDAEKRSIDQIPLP